MMIRTLFLFKFLFLFTAYTVLAESEKPAYLLYTMDRECGSYHSNQREGIIWYIEQAVKGYEILTINTILADDPENVDLNELQEADITLVVPSRMTRTN